MTKMFKKANLKIKNQQENSLTVYISENELHLQASKWMNLSNVTLNLHNKPAAKHTAWFQLNQN